MILLTAYIVYALQYAAMIGAALALFYNNVFLFYALLVSAYAPGKIATRLVRTKENFDADTQASSPRFANWLFKIAACGLIAIGSANESGINIPYWNMLDGYILFISACGVRDSFLFIYISKNWRKYEVY